MRFQNADRRTRHAQIGLPAAVIGVLAGTLTAAPATAAVPVEARSEQRFTGTPRPLPASTTPTTYTVQAGDTISAIAHRFGLNTVDVLTWNSLTWRSVIFPGQSLRLAATSTPGHAPAPAPTPVSSSTYSVVAGDTVFGIAQKNSTSVDAILTANGLTRASIIYPGQTLTISTAPAQASAPAPAPAPAPPAAPSVSSGTAHTVVAGDTIFGIAQKHGTSVAAVFAANGLSPSSIIYPGQSIIVAASAPVAAPAAPAPPATAPAAPAPTATLDAEQAENAALIIRIGRELGVSDRGIAIALSAAMVESWIRNLDWGDRDSLGLFQQRPSAGWGSAEQIMDRERSIRVFFGGVSDPNGANTRGLLDIPGWESMSFSDAAQSVQISAYPERYSEWESQAYAWLAQHG